ncbi:MAG: response regulator, partial [bacterium]
PKRIRILLIEDNKFDEMAFERLVHEQDLGYDYKVANCIAVAKELLTAATFDVIISDYYLGDGTLFDILNLIVDTPVIVTTGAGSQDVAIKAMKEGAYDYLIKDIDRAYLTVLPVTVENAIRHKQAEEKSRMLSHALMSINDSIYITDMNDRVTFVNKAFCLTYGYQEHEILGKRSQMLWSNDQDIKKILTKIDQFGWKSELRHRRKDGTEFPISLARSIIKDEKAHDVAVVGIAHDITEHKRAAEELRNAKEAAEAATRAKTEFLANMSHEICTPLNAIIGTADQLSETKLDSEQRRFIDTIQRTSDILLSLVADILELSNIEAGKVALEESRFQLRELVTRIIEVFNISAQNKGLEIICEIAPEIPDTLMSDPTRLRHILVNLVGNAVKFTERGEIRIKVEVADKEAGVGERDGKCRLLFSISDTGIGIPQENRARIFDKFSQVDNTTTRRFGGSGLGLSICKSLVELMGGRLEFESQEGVGSTFYFELELSYFEPIPKRNESKHPKSGLTSNGRILLVEDNPDNQNLASNILTKAGHSVVIAETGKGAVEAVTGSEYDLILMDIQMPVMDGFTATEKIRGFERRHQKNRMPIIALTAHTFQGYREKCLRHDMDDYLTKPFKKNDLLMTVDKWLHFESKGPD